MVAVMRSVRVDVVQAEAEVSEGSCPEAWVDQTAASKQIHAAALLIRRLRLLLILLSLF
jgi:hypothetical protein